MFRIQTRIGSPGRSYARGDRCWALVHAMALVGLALVIPTAANGTVASSTAASGTVANGTVASSTVASRPVAPDAAFETERPTDSSVVMASYSEPSRGHFSSLGGTELGTEPEHAYDGKLWLDLARRSLAVDGRFASEIELVAEQRDFALGEKLETRHRVPLEDRADRAQTEAECLDRLAYLSVCPNLVVRFEGVGTGDRVWLRFVREGRAFARLALDRHSARPVMVQHGGIDDSTPLVTRVLSNYRDVDGWSLPHLVEVFVDDQPASRLRLRSAVVRR